MALQSQVKSYNTVNNKLQSAQSAYSSRIMVILALAISGVVVFFGARFYLAEKNETVSSDTKVATGSETASDSTMPTGTASTSNSSSGSTSSYGGNANHGSSSATGSVEPDSSCTEPSIPEAACTSMRSIEMNGVVGNQYVSTSFPKIPSNAVFIIDDSTWDRTTDTSATVKMSAFYDGFVDRVVLQINLKGSNWVVTGFTQ